MTKWKPIFPGKGIQYQSQVTIKNIGNSVKNKTTLSFFGIDMSFSWHVRSKKIRLIEFGIGNQITFVMWYVADNVYDNQTCKHKSAVLYWIQGR